MQNGIESTSTKETFESCKTWRPGNNETKSLSFSPSASRAVLKKAAKAKKRTALLHCLQYYDCDEYNAEIRALSVQNLRSKMHPRTLAWHTF